MAFSLQQEIRVATHRKVAGLLLTIIDLRLVIMSYLMEIG